jgi:uncharacterized protein with HEPN domain
MTFDDFVQDNKTKKAVVKSLENIGEAAKNIPEDIREQYADIPWRDVADMRNILSHEYFGIDYRIVWKTMSNDLDSLESTVSQILSDLQSGSTPPLP